MALGNLSHPGIRDVSPHTQRATVASRSFIFHDEDSANRFAQSLRAGGPGQISSSGDFGGFTDLSYYLGAPALAAQYGGSMYRSFTGRESKVYGFQKRIYEQDREYLLDRDPTASMFIESPWAKCWNGLPLTYIAEIDAFFAEQMALGLLIGLQAAYQEFYQEGGAILYLEATGRPDQRLRRGDRPLRWTFIPAHQVLDQGPNGFTLAEGPAGNDPLLDHGFEFVSFYPSPIDKERGTPLQVHGSRVIIVNMDPRSQKWWRAKHIPFNRIYDTLWELRDLLFARVRAGFQGDPIVVDVDLSADAQKVLAFEQMDQKARDKMSTDTEAAIKSYNSGAKSTFAPVMGFKMRRLGAAQIPDPREDIMALASRLSHGTPYPVKMVLASTKGSTDVGDQDILTFAGNLQDYRNTWGYKHLHKALLMGQVMGSSSLRMQGDHDLPHPTELDWPLVRPLSPRDTAFTQKTDIVIKREAWEMGLKAPARIERKYPKDPSLPLPPWMAAKGRNMDGTNTDVDPMIEPGAAGDTPAPTPAPKPAPIRTPLAQSSVDDIIDAVHSSVRDALHEHETEGNNSTTSTTSGDST